MADKIKGIVKEKNALNDVSELPHDDNEYWNQERITLMKTAGIIIIIIGLLMTLHTGFSYVTKEKVVDLGKLEITKDDEHNVRWQPYLGIGMIVIGGVVLILDRKKSRSTWYNYTIGKDKAVPCSLKKKSCNSINSQKL